MSLSGGRSAADLDLDAVECSVPLQPLTVAGRQVENIQWQQNTERVQLFISGIRRSDQLKVEFGANHLRVSPSRQGSPAVLDGRLSYEIDPSASYWDVNGTQTVLEVVLIKRLKREWLSLFAPVQSSSTNAGIRSARPKRSASRSDTTQTIGGGDPAARNDPTPNVTASESAEQASTGSSALDQINELRRRLAEKVSALGGQSQSNDKVKSSAPTSGEPIPIAKTKDISSQLVKPPQKLDAAAAAVAEQSQAANGGRFSKWATFDEAAAIAEIENEGKPVVRLSLAFYLCPYFFDLYALRTRINDLCLARFDLMTSGWQRRRGVARNARRRKECSSANICGRVCEGSRRNCA